MDGAPVQLVAAGLTDVGRVRSGNEDAFLVDVERGLYIVSDGMGGAQAGALASRVVVSVLPGLVEARLQRLGPARSRAVRYWLRRDILTLSQRLCQQSAAEMGLKGMGATVVLALLRGHHAHIAHLGDSRAYLFRDGTLTQLTEDHSITAILVRNGEIAAEEASHHPARGRLSRFVGMASEVYPDVCTVHLATGDRILLCSDGLTGMVPDERIAAVLAQNADPPMACQSLIAAANAAGGRDNITTVLLACQRSRRGTSQAQEHGIAGGPNS